MSKKFNGTAEKPMLSVFCSDKQLYAMVVDDQKKKCLFYASTLQKSIRGDACCPTIEAARRVGEELVKACIHLQIHEFHLVVAMVWPGERKCRHLRLPFLVMVSCHDKLALQCPVQ